MAQIHRAAPGVPLRIWRQEDYRANAQAIMSREVCGPPTSGRCRTSPTRAGPARPAEGIRAAGLLPTGLAMAERRERVGEITAASGGEPFRPFAEAERSEIRARYAADLARIERDFPGEIMRFGA